MYITLPQDMILNLPSEALTDLHHLCLATAAAFAAITAIIGCHIHDDRTARRKLKIDRALDRLRPRTEEHEHPEPPDDPL